MLDPRVSRSFSEKEEIMPETTHILQKAEQLIESLTQNWQAWALGLGTLVVAVLAAWVVHAFLFFLLKRMTKRTKTDADDTLVIGLRKPCLLAFPLLGIQLVLPQIGLPQEALGFLRHMNGIALIASVMWILMALIRAVEQIILSHYRLDVSDNRHARHLHTQFRIMRRTLITVVIIIGSAAILMTFPTVRQLGTSLLASAGIAGLVLGLAARPTIENLVAGMQLAFTKPVTIDDVVVIQGEWGRIEEITATYVVVRIWDQRRLVVPFSWILQQPFQNWTRTTADILGTIYLHADYTVPVDELRAELERILKESPKWDGRVCGLVVTDAKAETLELRALVSAADSGSAWDLRCDVREKLIAFLQREYPHCLPRVRAELKERKPEEVAVSGGE
jgi:small-conductance mechanosensitive channel